MRPLKIAGLLTVLLLMVTGQAIAQGLLVEPSIGLKAGVNSSVIQVEGTGTFSRLGFTGGAGTESMDRTFSFTAGYAIWM